MLPLRSQPRRRQRAGAPDENEPRDAATGADAGVGGEKPIAATVHGVSGISTPILGVVATGLGFCRNRGSCSRDSCGLRDGGSFPGVARDVTAETI